MMSEEDIERLIKRVRRHPSLYDARNNSYKNLSIRAKRKIWENIGAELNITGDVARKKWRSLRDNYMRYRKEIITGQPTKKFGKWHWISHLKFLDTPLAERERLLNSRDSETPPRRTPEHVSSPTLSQNNENNDIDKLINFLQNKNNSECDAIDNLFKSYAQTFKMFSQKNQILLKVELAKLFSDVELKEMEEIKQIIL